jgi:cation:H+ antiporter
MLTYGLLILGFIFLIKGASLLVDGASSIAKKFGISSLVIGLTVVAFGTSAPELILNVIASFRGVSDMALGNIIGSNISNILLIGGIAAMIYPIKVKGGTTWKEIPLSLLALVVLLIFANDQIIDHGATSIISRIDGIALIAFFLIFLYYTFGIAKVREKDDTEYAKMNIWLSVGYIVLGMIGLALGGKWIIDSATTIASNFGLSDTLIGLTILAIGTSLPELATAVVAAFKKNADLAIGNIIGSNIFNIFFVVGVTAIIRPVHFNLQMNADILIGVLATLMLYYFVFTGKKERSIERYEGIGLFCAYLIYIVFLVWRG